MRSKEIKLLAVALGAVMAAPTARVEASSHREAPFITKNPKVDATDFYMFRSYESGRSNYVTLIANYQPLQDAYGGPNYFEMDPDALYEIEIDSDGDGVEDFTFQFQFNNALANSGAGVTLPVGAAGATKNIGIPIINFGAITAADQSKLNVSESYSVGLVTGPRRGSAAKSVVQTGTTTATFTKPVDYIGNTTFTNVAGYNAYVQPYIYNVDIPGCTAVDGLKPRVFVGQRQDGFAVNLGTIFDLVGAPAAASVVTGGTTRALRGDTVANSLASGANVLGLGNKNVTTIALEVPISCLTKGTQTVLGGWTTASVRQARVINPTATFTLPSKEGGAWTQVSRLGAPLVNEVVIGIKDKDLFNTSEPKNDAQFADYVTNPVLPNYLELLYGSGAGTLAPSGASFPRADLVAAFLTGVKAMDATSGTMVNVNQNGSTAEYLRLNTALPVTAPGSQNSLGAAACFVNGVLTLGNDQSGTQTLQGDKNDAKCDPAGFPNGRRPGDDVVDIALRVMMGYLIPHSATTNPASAIPFTDFAVNYDTQFGIAFPYLNTPNPGHP
jgi:hypothetical protein